MHLNSKIGYVVSPSQQYLKTKDVLQATGISHQVLYRYITMGLVEELKTQEGGNRVFSSETIPVIQLIKKLNQSGYTLRDIKDIFFKEGRLEKLKERGQS